MLAALGPTPIHVRRWRPEPHQNLRHLASAKRDWGAVLWRSACSVVTGTIITPLVPRADLTAHYVRSNSRFAQPNGVTSTRAREARCRDQPPSRTTTGRPSTLPGSHLRRACQSRIARPGRAPAPAFLGSHLAEDREAPLLGKAIHRVLNRGLHLEVDRVDVLAIVDPFRVFVDVNRVE